MFAAVDRVSRIHAEPESQSVDFQGAALIIHHEFHGLPHANLRNARTLYEIISRTFIDTLPSVRLRVE